MVIIGFVVSKREFMIICSSVLPTFIIFENCRIDSSSYRILMVPSCEL